MIVIISVRVGTEGFNLPVGEGSSLHLYWCWRKGCSSFEWSSVVRFSLFPRTKLYKFKTNQIGYFSFLIAGLPPTEGSARRAKGVQFLRRLVDRVDYSLVLKIWKGFIEHSEVVWRFLEKDYWWESVPWSFTGAAVSERKPYNRSIAARTTVFPGCAGPWYDSTRKTE